jgi:transcriptional regulator of aromatic amino acid metabolism
MQRIVGKSAAFLSTVEKIPRIAGCDAPGLVDSDTGTGERDVRARDSLPQSAREQAVHYV